jgi:3-oxoacyl-[acyl-carrier protein] reductase
MRGLNPHPAFGHPLPHAGEGSEGDVLDLNLKDKVVIVTGGAAGIGRATAAAFEKEGARVVVWDLPAVDVSKADIVERAAKDVIARHGRIDVLVNNAGILRDSQLVKWKDGAVVSMMDDATFDAVIGVNLKGVFLCTRAVVPHMIKGGGGVILNASSVVGLYGNFGQTNYAATKAGVINFTKTWSRELGKYNIRVNAVAPGFIATEMVKQMPPKILENMVSKTPLGKMGEPDDIANAYVWLASDAAKFVHGAVLSVDGGVVVGT